MNNKIEKQYMHNYNINNNITAYLPRTLYVSGINEVHCT